MQHAWHGNYGHGPPMPPRRHMYTSTCSVCKPTSTQPGLGSTPPAPILGDKFQQGSTRVNPHQEHAQPQTSDDQDASGGHTCLMSERDEQEGGSSDADRANVLQICMLLRLRALGILPRRKEPAFITIYNEASLCVTSRCVLLLFAYLLPVMSLASCCCRHHSPGSNSSCGFKPDLSPLRLLPNTPVY